MDDRTRQAWDAWREYRENYGATYSGVFPPSAREAFFAGYKNHFRDAAKMVREANIDGWRDACMWHREQGMGVRDSDRNHPYAEEA